MHRIAPGKKLRIKETRVRALAAHVFVQLPRHFDNREPSQVDVDPSTNNRPGELVFKTITYFLIFSAKVQQEMPFQLRRPLSVIRHREWLLFATETFKIAIRAKPAYRCRVSFEISPSAMNNTQCLLDTKAGRKLVNEMLIEQQW